MSSLRTSAFIPLLAIFGSVTFLGLAPRGPSTRCFRWSARRAPRPCAWAFRHYCSAAGAPRWRLTIARDLRAIACYGAALGGMNLMFYLSLQTLPFGVAVAIEFSGPLAVAVLSSRRALDFVWVLLAVAGWACLPLGHDVSTLDPLGVAYCWWQPCAGRPTSCSASGSAFACGPVGLAGLTVAALVVLPVGLAHSGMALLSWQLAVGWAWPPSPARCRSRWRWWRSSACRRRPSAS